MPAVNSLRDHLERRAIAEVSGLSERALRCAWNRGRCPRYGTCQADHSCQCPRHDATSVRILSSAWQVSKAKRTRNANGRTDALGVCLLLLPARNWEPTVCPIHQWRPLGAAEGTGLLCCHGAARRRGMGGHPLRGLHVVLEETPAGLKARRCSARAVARGSRTTPSSVGHAVVRWTRNNPGSHLTWIPQILRPLSNGRRHLRSNGG